MLTNESELIISARVEKISLIKREDGFNTGIARLNILSVLKGPAGRQIVDVYYEPDMVCPAPPHYEDDATVLAFLTRGQDGSGYFTVGLSYGAKRLTNREIEIYSSRIRELIEIEGQTDPNARQQRLIEWLIRCAEEPVTRWEGAYDLRNSHEMKMIEIEKENDRKNQRGDQEAVVDEKGLDERKEETIDFTALLSEDQKRRLVAALHRSYSLSNGVLDLIELVELWGDDNLVPFMWSYLKASRKDFPWDTRDLMLKIAILLKNQEALELTEKFESGIATDPEKEAKLEQERKAILQQFIEIIERAGPPRIVEINDEPETPVEPVPSQQRAEGKVGLMTTLLVFAILLIAIPAFRL